MRKIGISNSNRPHGLKVRVGGRLFEWLLSLMLLSFLSASAQSPMGIAYYELGPLYDTLPSPFYSDETYTPRGERQWSSKRYEESLSRYGALLDSMAMPVVGLFGVENEAVALDLAARSNQYYTLLHRTSNRLDGLDFALLYQADRLFPKKVEEGYGWLSIEAEWEGIWVVLLLVREERYLPERIEELRTHYPQHRLVVMGRCSINKHLQNGLRKAELQGRGSCRRKGGWLMRHRILVSPDWEVVRGDVYARRWLLDERTGSPLPLFQKMRYLSGYSENLPIFCYLRPRNLEH